MVRRMAVSVAMTGSNDGGNSEHSDLEAATRQCLRLTLHGTGACAGQHACGNRACEGLPSRQFDVGHHPLRFHFHSYGPRPRILRSALTLADYRNWALVSSGIFAIVCDLKT